MGDEKKSSATVKEFLKHNPHGVLSTVSDDGKPWGASIYFATDDDLNFYFITRVKTQKFLNISSNPHVSLTISDHLAQETVQTAGKVTKVPAKDIVNVVMKKLAHVKPHGDNKWVPPIIKVEGGDYTVLKLTPEFLQYADFKQTKSDIHDPFITRII